MKKLFVILLIAAGFIAGCSQQPENDELAAVVRGKEITVGDVRLLYDLENIKLAEAVEQYVNEEIMVQEAKRMGIEISGKVEELKKLNQSFPIEQEHWQSENAKQKAEQLGLTEEEYYEIYLEKSIERSAYISEYLNKVRAEAEQSAEDQKYAEKVREHTDSLMEKYADEIRIEINQ